jgi:hypothetical protein
MSAVARFELGALREDAGHVGEALESRRREPVLQRDPRKGVAGGARERLGQTPLGVSPEQPHGVGRTRLAHDRHPVGGVPPRHRPHALAVAEAVKDGPEERARGADHRGRRERLPHPASRVAEVVERRKEGVRIVGLHPALRNPGTGVLVGHRGGEDAGGSGRSPPATAWMPSSRSRSMSQSTFSAADAGKTASATARRTTARRRAGAADTRSSSSGQSPPRRSA